jgi:hypothetical protein
LNLRPRAYESPALPLSYRAIPGPWPNFRRFQSAFPYQAEPSATEPSEHIALLFPLSTRSRVPRPRGNSVRNTPEARSRSGVTPASASAKMRSEGLEPPTYKFVACCSIQLSYDRIVIRRNDPTTSVCTTQSCCSLLRFRSRKRRRGERGIRTLDTVLSV